MEVAGVAIITIVSERKEWKFGFFGKPNSGMATVYRGFENFCVRNLSVY